MFELALVDDRDGFKPAVRVLAHAAVPAGGLECLGTCIVQHEERTQLRRKLLVVE
jgi:hypothetical protein